MADLYASNYLSATYSQRMPPSEDLTELTSHQVKRQASTVWMISLFLFLYFALALGVALLESTVALFTLDYWKVVENLAAAAVHALGMLAASLGFYCTKVLEYSAVRRFVVALAVSLGVYACYLGTWTVLCYDAVIDRLKGVFKNSDRAEVTAAHLLVFLFVCALGVAGYFVYCAYRLKETMESWKELNPNREITKRSLSLVLDK